LATYVIGDLQGCLTPLKVLLDKLRFDDKRDTLWFVGDIVNRGPESLAALRFVKELGDSAITVLGNHDLHLLAVIFGTRKVSPKDTLDDILAAPDLDELTDWLRRQPLIHTDQQLRFTLTHAGVYPFWSLATAHALADEVHDMLPTQAFLDFLPHMYGNEPARWNAELDKDATTHDRWRFVINAFTRMRYCQQDGSLDYRFNGPPAIAPRHLLPWYAVERRVTLPTNLVFGHWSSHPGIAPTGIVPTDRGCVWGGSQTAYHLEERITYTCRSSTR